MKKSLQDKLWWISKVSSDIVVDYGCADGTLLKYIHHINPNIILIGIDINEQMLTLARNNVSQAIFMTPDEFYKSNINCRNATLVLSSVIHEIYSYNKDPELTLKQLFDREFKYVAIRDMFVSNNLHDNHEPHKLRDKTNATQLDNFEKYWGSIDVPKNYIHYLLKYRYVENWEREVKENYLPVNLEEFIKYVIPSTYSIQYYEHYLLPFLRKQVKRDFNIKLTEPTHLKILLKYRKEGDS